jgi:hypothetical protein
VQKHHEQISWTMKSTRCYMYGDGLGLMALGLGLGKLSVPWERKDGARCSSTSSFPNLAFARQRLQVRLSPTGSTYFVSTWKYSSYGCSDLCQIAEGWTLS